MGAGCAQNACLRGSRRGSWAMKCAGLAETSTEPVFVVLWAPGGRPGLDPPHPRGRRHLRFTSASNAAAPDVACKWQRQVVGSVELVGPCGICTMGFDAGKSAPLPLPVCACRSPPGPGFGRRSGACHLSLEAATRCNVRTTVKPAPGTAVPARVERPYSGRVVLAA